MNVRCPRLRIAAVLIAIGAAVSPLDASAPKSPPTSEAPRRSVTLASGLDPHRTSVSYDAPAAEHPARRIDLYVPVGVAPSGGFPVVVTVHGGGWRRGSPRSRTIVAHHVPHFTAAGFAVAAVGYRLDVEDGMSRHPEQVEDLIRALEWLHAHGARHGIDPDRLVLLGHSAGAHLATLAATDTVRRDPSRAPVCGVVSLDTSAYDVAELLGAAPAMTAANAAGGAASRPLRAGPSGDADVPRRLR